MLPPTYGFNAATFAEHAITAGSGVGLCFVEITPRANEERRYIPAKHESEQVVALGERQHGGRLAGQELAVGADLVGLGIDLEPR